MKRCTFSWILQMCLPSIRTAYLLAFSVRLSCYDRRCSCIRRASILQWCWSSTCTFLLQYIGAARSSKIWSTACVEPLDWQDKHALNAVQDTPRQEDMRKISCRIWESFPLDLMARYWQGRHALSAAKSSTPRGPKRVSSGKSESKTGAAPSESNREESVGKHHIVALYCGNWESKTGDAPSESAREDRAGKHHIVAL